MIQVWNSLEDILWILFNNDVYVASLEFRSFCTSTKLLYRRYKR